MKMKDIQKTFTVETEDRYGRLGDYKIEAPTLEIATAKAKSAKHYIFDIKEVPAPKVNYDNLWKVKGYYNDDEGNDIRDRDWKRI